MKKAKTGPPPDAPRRPNAASSCCTFILLTLLWVGFFVGLAVLSVTHLKPFWESVWHTLEKALRYLYDFAFTLQSPDVMFFQNFIVVLGWLALFFRLPSSYLKALFGAAVLPVCYNYAKIYVTHLGPNFFNFDMYSVEGWKEMLADTKVLLATIAHLAVVDLVAGVALSAHFYSKYSFGDYWYGRLYFTVILLLTFVAAPLGLLVYLISKPLIFKRYSRKPQVQKESDLSENSRPVHWGQTLPKGLRTIWYIIKAVVGLIGLVLHLAIYLLLVVLCVPYAFIYPRISPPQEPKKYKIFPRTSMLVPSFVRNATGQMRIDLLCVDPDKRGFFWKVAHHILKFAAIVDIGIHAFEPNKLTAALSTQFGGVFPFGDGIGISNRKLLIDTLQDPNILKRDNSLADKVCSSQSQFCHISTIILGSCPPTGETVLKARNILFSWIHNFPYNAQTAEGEPAYRALARTFPKILNGKLPSETEIFGVFGDILFFLATGGQFAKNEKSAFIEAAKNLFPFFPDWLNFLALGGFMERRANWAYYKLMQALAREKGPAYNLAMATARKQEIDENEALRLIASVFAIAGSAVPSKVTYAILERIFHHRNPQEMLDLYHENPINFIKECVRLDPAVFWVNCFTRPDQQKIHVSGKYDVPADTPVHCYIPFANLDPDVFPEPLEFNPRRTNLDEIMTWNGLEKLIIDDTAVKPPRYCPGHDLSIWTMKLVVDHYLPTNFSEMHSANQVEDEVHHGLDSVTKSVVYVTSKRVANWTTLSPADVKFSDSVIPDEDFPPFVFPARDEDDPDGKIEFLDDLGWVSTFLPVHDSTYSWNTADLIAWRRKYLPNFPQPRVDFTKEKGEYNTDEMISRLAFFGLACHHTKKIKAEEKSERVPRNATYVNDNTILSNFDVRDQYKKYGSAAYFDSKYRLIAIYVSHLDTLVTPNDKLWPHAKWVWKTSMFTIVTLNDHLCITHLIEATALARACVNNLAPTNPLRVVLKPFIFHTVYINRLAGKTLYLKNGLAERVWAFQDVPGILKTLKSNYKYSPNFVDPTMVDETEENFPIAHDYSAFRKIVDQFVTELFGLLEKQDKSWISFFTALTKELNLNLAPTKENFVELVSHLITNGTAVHEFVGQISDYQISPDFVGARLVDDTERFRDSVQAYVLNTALTTSTGILQPVLLTGWDTLLKERKDNASKAEAIVWAELERIYSRFIQNLDKLSKAINDRETKKLKNNKAGDGKGKEKENEGGNRNYPFPYLDPAQFCSSVSK